MRRELFVKIVKACEAKCRYFTCRRNAASLIGFTPYQKISAAMRILAYGIATDYTDEYLQVGEDTSIKYVRLFAKTMIRVFGEKYLRAPNEEDTNNRQVQGITVVQFDK
jgi:hypothetical protein